MGLGRESAQDKGGSQHMIREGVSTGQGSKSGTGQGRDSAQGKGESQHRTMERVSTGQGRVSIGQWRESAQDKDSQRKTRERVSTGQRREFEQDKGDS